MYNLNKLLIVETDALDFRLGVVIVQLNNKGNKQLVYYQLRKITLAELNYNIYNKELLAIVEAFKQQRANLQGANY